jgi:hypothetical protein
MSKCCNCGKPDSVSLSCNDNITLPFCLSCYERWEKHNKAREQFFKEQGCKEEERVRVEKTLAFALWVQACHEELWVEFEKKVYREKVSVTKSGGWSSRRKYIGRR